MCVIVEASANRTGEKKMNKEQITRVKQAISECDAFITKESQRPAATRPADMQKHLDFCIAHKARLLGMIGG